MTAQQHEEAPALAYVYTVYDTPHQEVVGAYESQRDAQTFCDEWNAYYAYERYVVERDEASWWGEDQIVWADR